MGDALACLSCALEYADRKCPENCCAGAVLSRDDVDEQITHGYVSLFACEVGGCCTRFLFLTDGYVVTNEIWTATSRDEHGNCEEIRPESSCKVCADAFKLHSGSDWTPSEERIDCRETGVQIPVEASSGLMEPRCVDESIYEDNENPNDTLPDPSMGMLFPPYTNEDGDRDISPVEPSTTSDVDDQSEPSVEPSSTENVDVDAEPSLAPLAPTEVFQPQASKEEEDIPDIFEFSETFQTDGINDDEIEGEVPLESDDPEPHEEGKGSDGVESGEHNV